MTHTEMDELYELYVLNLLEPELAAEIDRHLAEGCDYCPSHVKDAFALTAALAGVAPLEQPPAALRDRVLASIPETRSKIVAMPPPVAPERKSPGALYALSAACAALLLGCIWLGYQNGQMRTDLTVANRNRTALEATLKNLARTGTQSVAFGKADAPHGRVFVNRGTGVVFVGSDLPKIASGRTFQLWLIPASGGPQSAGTFQSDSQGSSVQVSPVTVEPGTKAVAVSVEPQSGSAAPTTTPIIVVPLAAE